MATYSFNIKAQPITKYGSKLNAAAHFDYIDRFGPYENREDLLATGCGNVPDWAPTSRHYWEAASLYERKNGNAYREITWALPSELPLDENVALVKEFCQETFGEKFTYSFAIHSKESTDPEHNNVHAHIMFNERELDPNRQYDHPKYHFCRYTKYEDGYELGLEKSRDFMQKKHLHLLRERAADLANKYYEENGLKERVDHRSFKNQKASLEAQGRFSEAALLDVPPKRRVPAAQYYKQQRELAYNIESDVAVDPTQQINQAHNEAAQEMRSMQKGLYEKFHNQDVVYAVNIKDYFGELRHAVDQEIQSLNKQIKKLRDEKVPDKAIETWAKNQIIPGYSKQAKQLKSTIETLSYKKETGMINLVEIRKLDEATQNLKQLEARIPADQLKIKKQAIVNRNQEIDEQIKPLYAELKPLQGKGRKYDRVLNAMDKLPNDHVVYVVSQRGILIGTQGIKIHDNDANLPIKDSKMAKLPNAKQARPTQKSFASSPHKAKFITQLASKIERKVDQLTISNEGGFVAKKELTAEDIQEMVNNGREM